MNILRKLKNFLKNVSGIFTPMGGVSWQVTKGANLSLVDLLIIDTNEFPKIEVKVRNSGDEVAFLKRAEFVTLGQWGLPQPGRLHPRMVPVSWTYDVKVPRQGSTTINISQEVKPNSVDRFEFRLAPDYDCCPLLGLCLYLLRIKLIYNEDDKELVTPPILLHIPPEVEVLGAYLERPTLSELEENKRTAQEILKNISDKIIVQKGILKAVKSWAEADFSDFKEE
jgi:hypothetical protein